MLLDDREQVGEQLSLDLGELDPVDRALGLAVGDLVDRRAQRRDQTGAGFAVIGPANGSAAVDL